MASLCSELNENVCVICRVEFISSTDKDVSEVSRGLQRLLEYSEKYNDVQLTQYLLSKPPVVKVHNSCRRNYISKRRYEQKCSKNDTDESAADSKFLRSTKDSFDWKVHCFFCSQPCVVDDMHSPNLELRHVETLEIRENTLEQCKLRGDAWALEVQSRLMTCCDLVAEEAIYHKSCHRNFYRTNIHVSCGRPVDNMKGETFEKVCEWLEVNDCEFLTLQDVVNKAQTLVPNNDEVYSEKWIKQKLIQQYGDHIQFNEVRGRHNVICWKEMASYVVNEKWRENKSNQSEHIVVTAAKLLRATICEAPYDTDSYPQCTFMENTLEAKSWMPHLLQLFLDHLIYPEEKKTALGHCVVQAVRPRTAIAPIPFGVGVSVDHISASKYLINLLHRLGMSCSYDEVHRFKQSVARCKSAESHQSFPQCFTQYAADNVDHNVCSLDGIGTLHAMGIISIANSSNSAAEHNTAEVPVPRLKVIKTADVSKVNRIPLLPCSLPNESTAGITFKSHFYAADPCTLSASINLDTLWHLGWFLQDGDEVRPSWAGFNSSVVRGNRVQSSDIQLQPVIDRNPNDPSCIYSTLVFVAKESEKLGMQTAVITFDQPLWLKAVNIVNTYGLNVVCRLGAFHLQMSFLGSLGTLMSGSGLSDIMECCYGPNTVRHIMSGKAVARAVRAHCMVEAALTVMLLKLIFSTGPFSQDMSDLRTFYSYLLNNGFDDQMAFPAGLCNIEDALVDLKRDLSQKSRTAKLWLQYLYYVSTLKLLLRAERMADWQLHLVSIRRMINLFAATGHANYAKCGRLYIEMMTDLPDTHPDLYEQFMAGAHIARRSNKLWGGLSVDLTIEQALMRAVKGRGGLTHDRGVTESVRTTWIASVHKTGAVKTALAQFAKTDYCHDVMQHPELGKSRTQRDHRDLLKLLDFLESHNPFQSLDSRLQCLTSGIAATESDNINCDDAEKVGASIMVHIDGMNFSDARLKRKDQVRTLIDVTNTVRTGGKKHLISIDPTVLFNRLLVIMQRSSDMERHFCYELSAQPAALFKDSYMRKTDKSQLAKEICKDMETSLMPRVSVPVIDGGYLLRVVMWSEGASYADVAQQYVQYVGRHYGRSSVIVFDGYCCGPSTKDHEHQRRAHKLAPDIVVDPVKDAYHDQFAFLGNDKNKCAFVSLLITSLQAAGYTVHQAPDDADTLVVKVALQLATGNDVVSVIANDTDILIMLVVHYRPHMSDIFMYTGSGQRVTSVSAVAKGLGAAVVSRLLVIHAISGCDTASSLFGHGKVSVFKKLSRSPEIQASVSILESCSVSQEEVMFAGSRILALLYAGNITDSLNRLRYTMYMHATATSTGLPRPERLPPTENAARYHLYRVHLQVVQWKLLSTAALNPAEWGWKVYDGKYIPVVTDIDIAPPDILKVACCKCSAESKRPCGTRTCLCVKYGLSCVTACKNCNGEACENVQATAVHDVLEEAEEGLQDSAADDIVDDEDVEFYMPWTVEEEVVTMTSM